MAQTELVGRVLIVVQNLSVPLDRRVWLECNTLLAAGYQVSVICPKAPGDPDYEVLAGVHVHKYRPAPAIGGVLGYVLEFAWCWFQTARLSLRVAAREGFDVLQACNPPDTYWALALPYKLFGKRFVYDQHDLCPEVFASRFGDSGSALLRRGLLLLERATYRTADHVISTNASYRRTAISRGGKPPEQVTIVRSGPDTARMKPGERCTEHHNGRQHLACYLGVMGPQDGVDLLLRSWAVLVHEMGRDDCQLALLGFGDCYDDLVALSVELDLAKHVSFTGRADAAMVAEYLSCADLGVCPDPHSPLNDVSTMNKTMEYMAFGLPVVSFDLAESIVSGGDAVVYVQGGVAEFAAAVADLLDSPDRRREIGARARQRAVAVLDWRMQAPGYVSLFDRLRHLPARHLVVLPATDGEGMFAAIPDRRAGADRDRDVRATDPRARATERVHGRGASDSARVPVATRGSAATTGPRGCLRHRR